ncbi:hypothetical protein [Streptomyces clavuligerus]|uniref:hypothetical protein n=1 Tax=Streptomyces clavuligerus TaxID=1901 RepID=UPI0001800C69|nr:hypothetical protein [Streptomyces clavuligerus]EDY53113.1 hypothetical protein SSCG_05920 [Streptomyces clavuligerus]WDN56186.1 hypothetical protein LL058_30495 [Streptomyces clavuligerus]
MDYKHVTGHDGIVHEGLLNSHTGFLIDVACEAGRYAVVHHYRMLDPARVTKAPLSCPECLAANSPATAQLHRGRLARQYAEGVLALADTRGCPPGQDDEGLRLAFVSLALDNPPPRSLYALIKEHVTDMLTDRALAAPKGVPQVLVPYRRYTGGTVQAPVGPGDRLMHYGAAGGYFQYVWVDGLKESADGIDVTVREKGQSPVTYSAQALARRYEKLDRAPLASERTAAPDRS